MARPKIEIDNTTHPGIPHKHCSHCRLLLPVTAFHVNKGTNTGRQPWCIPCFRSFTKRARLINLEEFVCEECKITTFRRKTSKERTLCVRCAARKRTLDSPSGRPLNWTGSEYFPGKLIFAWKHSATKRNIKWDLTKEDLDNQLIKQDRKCALSGIEMNGSHNSPFRASIDRIESSGDYVVGSFQFVCSMVNVMKNKYKEVDFIKMCGIISEHAKYRTQQERQHTNVN